MLPKDWGFRTKVNIFILQTNLPFYSIFYSMALHPSPWGPCSPHTKGFLIKWQAQS